MPRPRVGSPEEAAARKRALTAARVRRLRDRRRAPAPADDAPAPPAPLHTPSPYAAAKLASFVERIERLEAELATLAATRRRNPALKDACARESAAVKAELAEVWAALEDSRFSVAATRAILRLRKMDDADRRELETKVDLYKRALGMD